MRVIVLCALLLMATAASPQEEKTQTDGYWLRKALQDCHAGPNESHGDCLFALGYVRGLASLSGARLQVVHPGRRTQWGVCGRGAQIPRRQSNRTTSCGLGSCAG